MIMDIEKSNQESQIKTYALTSANLRKFEAQWIKVDRDARTKILERTDGDGKSEKQSVLSLHSGMENNTTKKENDFEKPWTRVRRPFRRPERDSERRNPEGQSQNESTSAHRLSGKTIIYDEEDNHIPYEDPSYMTNKHSSVSQENKHELFYEMSSASSSTVTQVRTKKIKRNLKTSMSDGSIPTSTSADSDDGLFSDGDFISADSSDEYSNEETLTTKEVSYSYYTSSVSGSSVSSIPTLPFKQGSSMSAGSSRLTRTNQTPNFFPSVTPEKNQTKLDSMAEARPASIMAAKEEDDPLERSKIHAVLSRPSSRKSHISSRNSAEPLSIESGGSSRKDHKLSLNSIENVTNLSREDSWISSWSERTRDATSRGITSRKDSLISIDSGRTSYVTIRNWSRWSKYSEGGYSITNKILPPKRRKPQRNGSQSPESSSVLSLESESNFSDSPTSTSSYSSVAARLPHLDNDPSVNQSQEIWRMSNLSLRSRSNPATEKSNPMNTKYLKTKVKLRKETENDVEGYDFKHRTKKIPKLRDRPKKEKKESIAGSFSNQRSPKKGRQRREDGHSVSSSSSYSASLRRKSSSASTTTKTVQRKLKSSASMSTDNSLSRSSSSASSSDRRRRRKDNNLRPLNVDDSGFISDNSPSSCASIRPVDTPFSPAVINRYAHRQSIDSEYSSYQSVCRSSCSSHRSASSLSLSSHSDEERSAVKRVVEEPPPKPQKHAKKKRKARAKAMAKAKTKAKLKVKTKLKPKIKQDEKQEIKEEARKEIKNRRIEEKKEIAEEITVEIEEEMKEKLKEEMKEKIKEEVKEEMIEEKISTKVSGRIVLPPVKPTPQASRRKTCPYNTSLSPIIKAKMKALRKEIKKQQKDNGWKYAHEKVINVNHPMPSFEDAYRDHGIQRLIKLARPKESKAVWATSFWPVRWGDQTMIFPLSKSAMKFSGTPRLEQLAIAKKDFRRDHPDMCARDAFQYSCGRSSVIMEVSPLAMKGEASARVIELAKHKTTLPTFEERAQRDNYIFSCGRSSPIWHVTEGAKTSEDRERTMNLAQPKKNHPHYQPEKHCIWPVSSAARRASPSPRTEYLARPKTRSEGLHREPIWVIPPSALRTVASARVQELAKAKQTAEGYAPCKELDEPIPRSVLRASATDRLKTLSKPIIRETMDHVQFNPDAFKVSPAALKGRLPDRIAELAQPLSRR